MLSENIRDIFVEKRIEHQARLATMLKHRGEYAEAQERLLRNALLIAETHDFAPSKMAGGYPDTLASIVSGRKMPTLLTASDIRINHVTVRDHGLASVRDYGLAYIHYNNPFLKGSEERNKERIIKTCTTYDFFQMVMSAIGPEGRRSLYRYNILYWISLLRGRKEEDGIGEVKSKKLHEIKMFQKIFTREGELPLVFPTSLYVESEYLKNTLLKFISNGSDQSLRYFDSMIRESAVGFFGEGEDANKTIKGITENKDRIIKTLRGRS